MLKPGGQRMQAQEEILMEVVVNLSELKEERFSSCNMSPDELLSDKLSSGSKLVNMRLF